MTESTQTYGSQAPLYSITNTNVAATDHLDSQSPFDFYSFLRYSTQDLPPVHVNDAYQKYLVNWGSVKNYNATQSVQLVKDRYVELLRDITLNYLTYEERRFINAVKRDGLNDASDLDIIIPFYSKKLREICNFYASKRETLKFKVKTLQEKGNSSSVERSIFETLTDYITVADDDQLVTNVPALKIENILNNLNIEIEELYDLYSSYLDSSPSKSAAAYGATGLREKLFSSNINDVEADLFLNFDDAVKNYIFNNVDLYLSELGTSFAVNLNINAVDLACGSCAGSVNELITSSEDQASRILNLKKRLIQKYIGTDFYYIKTDTTTNVTSGVLFTADNPTGNLLNRHFPTTASVEEDSALTTIRKIGLFFRPEKNGILYFSAPDSRYIIDKSKLEPNKVYIFPDPSLYGNTTNLTNEVDALYPLIHIHDYSKSVHNAGQFFAEGDPKIEPSSQSFYAYYSRDQITQGRLSNYEGLSTNIAGIYNSGIVTQWSNDIYGNQYGLFKSSQLKPLIDATTSASQPSVTAYEYYDGGRIRFDHSGDLPEESSSDRAHWVQPNLFSSNYYYNAMFDGGIGAILSGIMVRPMMANKVYNGLLYTTPWNYDFDVILNDSNNTFSSGTLIIDCGFFTDLVIYAADLTLTYVISSIQYKDMDGGPIEGLNITQMSRDTGKNLYLTELAGDNTTKTVSSAAVANTCGSIYIRDVISGEVSHLSAAATSIINKYPNDVKAELLSCVKDFNIYNDIVYFNTENYFIVDKIDYTTSISSGSETKNYINTPASANGKISLPFFFNDKDYSVMCRISAVSADTNACVLLPTFFKIDNTTARISRIPVRQGDIIIDSPTSTSLSGINVSTLIPQKVYDALYFNTPSYHEYDILINYNNNNFNNGTLIIDGGHYVLENVFSVYDALSAFHNPLTVKITRIEQPVTTYNSRNNLFTVITTLYDSNDLAYIYQMYLSYDEEIMTMHDNRVISLLSEGVSDTINWYDTPDLSNFRFHNITPTLTSIDSSQGTLAIYGA